MSPAAFPAENAAEGAETEGAETDAAAGAAEEATATAACCPLS